MENAISPTERLQHLVELAQSISFDPHKPLRYYIVLVNELQQRGKKAILDQRFEESFVTLVRMLLVIISYIPKHPDYQIIDQSICKDLDVLKERYFSITSQIKQLLRKKYQHDYETNNNRIEKAVVEERRLSQLKMDDATSSTTTTTTTTIEKSLDPYTLEFSYKSIANKLKQPQSSKWEYHNNKAIANNSYDKINSQLSNVSYKELLGDFNSFRVDDDYQQHTATTKYDTKIQNKPNTTAISNDLVNMNDSSSSLPDLENFSSSFSSNTKDTLLNASIQYDPLHDYFDNNKATNSFTFDRSLKPDYSKMHIVTNSNNSSFLDDTNSSSNNNNNIVNTTSMIDSSSFGEGDANASYDNLLSVIIPADTVERFTDNAIGDISNNIETLGVLAGVLINNTYILTHILIPKQSGTSDSCEMLNENEVFLYQIENNLLTLGWIHTHPTQSCFLSSVDLHTHFSYQCQLNEAMAIVVSHRKKCFSSYVFHLTARGMETIKNCNSRGFHPHEKNLFEVYEYVENDHKKSIKIVDMRLQNTKYL